MTHTETARSYDIIFTGFTDRSFIVIANKPTNLISHLYYRLQLINLIFRYITNLSFTNYNKWGTLLPKFSNSRNDLKGLFSINCHSLHQKCSSGRSTREKYRGLSLTSPHLLTSPRERERETKRRNFSRFSRRRA